MTIAPNDVNLPEVLAELRELYPRYEQALVTNDVDTLVAMFWASPQVMRFGATENLYGHEELEASPWNLNAKRPKEGFLADKARYGSASPKDGASCLRMSPCCRLRRLNPDWQVPDWIRLNHREFDWPAAPPTRTFLFAFHAIWGIVGLSPEKFAQFSRMRFIRRT